MMPVVNILDIKIGQLGILKLSEPAETLIQNFRFSEFEKKEYVLIKNETRRKEYLAVRILLEELTGKKSEIIYDANRKPQLKNHSMNISISHSPDLAVVLLSEKNAGVDVENIHRNTEKVATRFLSENELNDIIQSTQPNLQRMLYWCAKEAAFKFSYDPEIEFKKHISIHNLEIISEGGMFYGQLSKNLPPTKLAFRYFFYENNVVTYCVEEENIKNENT